ncbi:SurA N-terminal domain-containing protein [Tissierella creatinophila]|uniref:peptidylprolyl isomerase n=1 Tax=Tissierella creatinophila DSM 6911 TaxID=1123403 RepID=A0A1U7M6R3_TISCR|nr:SurA N-terminal domain-containing protein [Tissierella creatinophila]OLS03013.1 foldase protein PrsA precursor [Tissierella creatinophila DSM 6911]
MHKLKRKGLLFIFTIIAMSIIINGCTNKAPEGVVATVNKEDIKKETLDREYSIEANLVQKQLGEGVLDQVGPDGKIYKDSLKDSVLSKLIIERVILQDAKKNKIEATEEEIDTQINNIKEGMGGEEKLNEFIKDSGIDKDYFRNYIKKQLLAQKHKENFIEKFNLEDKDAEKFFNENKEKLIILKARHILVETEEKGNEILEKLKNGEDFKKLAIENSQDTSTPLAGGESGYFSRGYYPEEFDKVVFGLKEGELSPLIHTEIGYHIVELEERKDTFKALKSDLTPYIKENKYDEYIKKLQDDAKIKNYVKKENKDKEKK